VRVIPFTQLGDSWNAANGMMEALSWRPDAPRPEFERVIGISKREYVGDMIHLRTKMGRRLFVTADHPMVARIDGQEPEVVLAGDLTEQHWLPLAIGDPLHNELSPDSASMLDAIEPAGLEPSQVILRLAADQAAFAPLVDSALPTHRRYDSRRSHTMRLDEAGLIDLPLTGSMCGTTTNGTYVPLKLPLNERTWEAIGLYLAEGHISTDGQRRRTCWSFHPTNEEHLVEFVANTWRSLGIKTTVRRLTTARQVSISSRLFASIFEHVLGVGTSCYNHRIPDLAWTAAEDERQALLRGLWSGDGSWSYVNGGPSVVLEYGTVSRELADGMVRMFATLGIVARLKVGRVAKSTVDTYWLSISGADQIEDALWLLEPHERPVVRASIDKQAKRIAPTGYRMDDKATAWVRVVDVQREHVEQTVYSAEVVHNHTIVTSFGLVAHNCFPKDTRAMVKIAENAGYDFNLLKGVVVVNDEQRERMVTKVETAVGGDLNGKVISAWGLTFKANTDDIRDSPAIAVITELQARGAIVRAYDPQVKSHPSIDVGADAYGIVDGADALIVLTEWDEFRWLDLEEVKRRLAHAHIVDTRNLLDRSAALRLGFTYQGVGR
ncbi:MAG: UDP binding domain-containing protein, partial [Ilumatobacteraceae bacterium]